jgi:hypothetical protein
LDGVIWSNLARSSSIYFWNYFLVDKKVSGKEEIKPKRSNSTQKVKFIYLKQVKKNNDNRNEAVCSV